MITKVLEMNGSKVGIFSDGSVHKMAEYPIEDTDIVDNGDGTFSIPSITDPRHGEYAYTVDGNRMLMYGGTTKVWYEWWRK